MDIGLAIAATIVLIAFAVILAALFAQDTRLGSGFAAWATFCVTLGLSFAGWFLYIAVHFLAKVW